MKIAFLYVAEPYQCYHVAKVASELAMAPGCEVTEFVSFPETCSHLDSIRRDDPARSRIGRERLAMPPAARVLRAARRFDAERLRVMKAAIGRLETFDAVVATEYSAGILREMGLRKPALILIQHGAGDRVVNDEHLVRAFDLVLLPGRKVARMMTEAGHTTPDRIRLVGYPKFDAVSGRRVEREATGEKKTALYNPHYKRGLSSYRTCLAPLVQAISAMEEYDLLVAPHVKIFHRDLGMRRHFFRKMAGPGIAIDTCSTAMLDMTHTTQASLYIGDVSSQVYEFLVEPRPCVFLNPHRVAWRGNPRFLHWTLGDVVERIEDIPQALSLASSRHALYRGRQERVIEETFGPSPLAGASLRAAGAIRAFLSASAGPERMRLAA